MHGRAWVGGCPRSSSRRPAPSPRLTHACRRRCAIVLRDHVGDHVGRRPRSRRRPCPQASAITSATTSAGVRDHVGDHVRRRPRSRHARRSLRRGAIAIRNKAHARSKAARPSAGATGGGSSRCVCALAPSPRSFLPAALPGFPLIDLDPIPAISGPFLGRTGSIPAIKRRHFTPTSFSLLNKLKRGRQSSSMERVPSSIEAGSL